jgi:hypothetical protein
MIGVVLQPMLQELQELLLEAEGGLLGGVVMGVVMMVVGVVIMMVVVMHAGSPWGTGGSKSVAGLPTKAARGDCRPAS